MAEHSVQRRLTREVSGPTRKQEPSATWFSRSALPCEPVHPYQTLAPGMQKTSLLESLV